VGIDLVRVSRVAESLERHGQRFLTRIFTEREVAYARASPALMTQRLAARFAAKEAAMKALGAASRPIAWRDIEVCRAADGSCAIALRGTARSIADECRIATVAVSLSHEGDYATAVVIASVHPTSL
jgi:holo-[acyl-carrier protein] synthase